MTLISRVGLAAIALATCGIAFAADSVDFDGERYLKAYEAKNEAFQLVEYIRSNDKLKQWYKLVAIRNFPGMADPVNAAKGLAREVVTKNSNAKPRLFTNDAMGEAAVVFVTYPENLEFIEFNVFRYRKCASCVGLISYQFAARIYDGEITEQVKDEFQKNQLHWRNVFLKMEFAYPFEK
jgi:hypothetical protein